MNIKDVQDVEKVENKLEAIFLKQRSLMATYHPIEERNGLLRCKDIPVNLHDKFGQAQLKDFAWRFTEELGEASAALHDDDDQDHFQEELIDALHFLTELSILSGLSFEDIGSELEEIIGHYKLWEPVDIHETKMLLYLPIEELSRAMNCLKNKPWKQTHILTDEKKYRGHVIETYRILICILVHSFHMTPEMIYNIYFKKNEVNKFRQRSKY